MRQTYIDRHVRSLLGRLAVLLLAAFLGTVAGTNDARAAGSRGRERLLQRLTAEGAADLHFLEHLGWLVVDDPSVSKIEVTPGRPGTRDSLQQARAVGDLRIRIPPTATDIQLQMLAAQLPTIAESVASRLAYQLRLAPAVDRATKRLFEATEKELYTFPQLLVVESPFWALSPPVPEWVKVEKTWRPRCSVRAAMESIYTKETTSECYAGQILALYATQMELYGPARFDVAFKPEEFVVGRPPKVETVPFGWNCWIPDYHKRRALFLEGAAQNRDPALGLAELGYKAFFGGAGIIRDPRGRMYCNENFVLVSITARAVDELVAGGGFIAIKKLAEEALYHHQAAKNMFATADTIRASREAIQAVYARPVFTDIVVYIHPYGPVTLKEVAEKKLKEMDSAITMELYCCGREYAFFQRYRETFHRLWHASNGRRVPRVGASRTATQ